MPDTLPGQWWPWVVNSVLKKETDVPTCGKHATSASQVLQ